MRTCQDYEALVSAFLDGELSDEERAEVGAHLAACPACQRYFDDLVAIHDAFDQVEDSPVPEGFSVRVMSKVRQTPQEEKTDMIRFPHWRRWAALAACCAVAVLGVWFRSGGGDMGAAPQTPMADSNYAIARDAAPPASMEILEDAPMALMEENGEAIPDLEEPSTDEFTEAQKEVAESLAESLAETDGLSDPDAGIPEAEMDCGDVGPAMAVPAGTSRENLCSGILSASGETARIWVESELNLDWEAGRTYLLTEEEFSGLLDALTAAGEDFRLEDSEGCWLLAEP